MSATAVLPYQPCVGCYAGDTTTGVEVVGNVTAHLRFLTHHLQIPVTEAVAMLVAQRIGESERERVVYRVCADCANDLPIGTIIEVTT